MPRVSLELRYLENVKMKEIKMSENDVILYCLNELGSIDKSDIHSDRFEMAVRDDQSAPVSITKIAKLGADLIINLTEQNKMLREALEYILKSTNYVDIDIIATEALEKTKCK
jgi:hypothetical protein